MGILFACLGSYLVGSIPSGLILGKAIWNIDLRQYGSHNIGATNAWRTIGKQAGVLIFLCDLLKGVFGVWLGDTLSGTPISLVLGGIFAIIGHSWSFFLRFKGGKGVATGLGVILSLMTVPAIIIFAIWFAIVKITGYVSLGSIIGAALVPVFAWLFGEPCATIGFGCLAAAFVIFRHKENIQRLLAGTESKIKAAKR